MSRLWVGMGADAGCSGVMVPYVNTAEEAAGAAASMRYPPEGTRGVAKLNRASRFGWDFDEYFARANDELLTVVQIETAEAVASAREIAAADGVDVLFIGPLDLSTNLGVPQQLDHPRFRECVAAVNDACRAAGKAAGILLAKGEQVAPAVADGFTFVALGSDGSAVASGMQAAAAALNAAKGGPG